MAARLTFRLRRYDCIGFDMDHTLCRYRMPAFFEMQYQVLADYLITQKGYDSKLQRPIGQDDEDFLQKGLVLDVERGNILKISASGEVLRASHGTRQMNREETVRHYGPQRTNDWLRRLAADPMIDSVEAHFHRKYRPFKDYFDLPAALVSARIVDLLDYDNNNKPLDKYSFWRDVLMGLVFMFNRDNLKLNIGGYYPAMKARPEEFLRPCSDKLKRWLSQLKSRQVTFMISGSDPEYVDHVAAFCLGPDWQTYFDFVVCASKKPGFFSLQRPFQRWQSPSKLLPDQRTEVGPDEILAGGTPAVYLQGNWAQLKASMAEYCGAENPKCLYFGDHLVQDVLAADMSRLDAVAILEELEQEDPTSDYVSGPSGTTSRRRWGSFFRDESQLSGGSGGAEIVPTLWCQLIQNHGRLCIADVELLAQHPADHSFTAVAPQLGSNSKFLGFLSTS